MKTSIQTQIPIASEILAQAAQWQARLWSDDVTETDQHNCLLWRQENSLHEQAWQMINGFNQNFDQVPKSQQQTLLQSNPPIMSNWIKKGSTLCLILGAGLILITRSEMGRVWTADHKSQVGEVKTIPLSDGTQLILASNSAVNVKFDHGNRQIDLLKGQIFVETGHKYDHLPVLKVHSSNTTIEPLGTQFTTKKSKEKLAVAVYEGAVKINSKYIQPSVIIKAGWQTQFDPNQPSLEQQKNDPLQLAWIQHKLVVEQMPICDFIRELAHYHSGYIRCAAELQNIKISGTYSLSQTEQTLQKIPDFLPVSITTYGRYFTSVNVKSATQK